MQAFSVRQLKSNPSAVLQAAQVAGITLPRFLELLASLQIPIARGDVAELQNDLAVARRW